MKTRTISFSKVIKDSTKNFTKIKKQDYLEHGKYKIIDQGQDFVSGYTNKKEFVNFDNIPLIIFGDHTKIFKYIDFPIAIGADGVKVLTVDSKIADTKYVYYYLRSLKLHDGGYSRHFKYLKTKKIVLPEDKQYQIKIANLLTQVETLIDKREESIRLLDELLKSSFLDMFGDPVLNLKRWKVVPLSNLGEINRGVSKHRPRNAPELLGGKYPLIQTGDIANADLYVEKFTQTYSDIGLAQSKLWAKDTLCITIAANIAKTAILKFDACFPDSVVGMEIKKEETNLFYVHFLFKFFQKLLEKNAPQAAQKNINLHILRNLKVPKPPKPLQDKFATIVQQVEATKKHYQKSLDGLNELFGSVSQRAFRGELDLPDKDIIKLSASSALDTSSSSGTSDIIIESQKSEYIKGRAKSGAGNLPDVLDLSSFIRGQREDLGKASATLQKSINKGNLKSSIEQAKSLNKSLGLSETIKQMSSTAELLKSLNIPSIKIDIPPLYTNIPSINFDNILTFKTTKQIFETMQKKIAHINQMLEDIPQINDAIENGVLCEEDFGDLILEYDYEYSQIKRIIMDKLISGEITQKFDEEHKSMKLVKST